MLWPHAYGAPATDRARGCRVCPAPHRPPTSGNGWTPSGVTHYSDQPVRARPRSKCEPAMCPVELPQCRRAAALRPRRSDAARPIATSRSIARERRVDHQHGRPGRRRDSHRARQCSRCTSCSLYLDGKLVAGFPRNAQLCADRRAARRAQRHRCDHGSGGKTVQETRRSVSTCGRNRSRTRRSARRCGRAASRSHDAANKVLTYAAELRRSERRTPAVNPAPTAGRPQPSRTQAALTAGAPAPPAWPEVQLSVAALPRIFARCERLPIPALSTVSAPSC